MRSKTSRSPDSESRKNLHFIQIKRFLRRNTLGKMIGPAGLFRWGPRIANSYFSLEGSTMKKYLIIGVIGAVALAVVVKKTNVCSCASTLFARVERDAKS